MKGKLVAVAAFMALTACGGGGGGGGVPIAASGPGFRIADGGVPTPGALGTIEGNTSADGTAIFVDDGVVEFFSASGSDNGEALVYTEGGVTVLRIRPERTASTTYGFVRYIDMDYSGTDTRGVLANFTRLADMPSSGTATYTGNNAGEAHVWVNGSGTPVLLRDGDVTVSVDFGAEQDVDVVVNNLSGGLNVTGYTINNLAISGNAFVTDGTTTFTVAEGEAALDFSGSTFDASGVFAGFNDNDGAVTSTSDPDNPAEIGGMVIARGPDGDTLFGRFAAD